MLLYLFLGIACVVVFKVQFLLCFTPLSPVIRALPLLAFFLLTAVLAILTVASTQWDAVAYVILTILSGTMLASCAVAWAAWAVIRFLEKRS